MRKELIIICLSLVLLFSFCVNVKASWIHYDNFDSGSFQPFWNFTYGTPYAITNDSSYVYNGTYGLYSTTDNGYAYYSESYSNISYYEFMFKIVPSPDEPPTGDNSGLLLEWFSYGYYSMFQLTVCVDNNTRFFDNHPHFRMIDDNGYYLTGTHGIESNKWYKIDIRVRFDYPNAGINESQVILYMNNTYDTGIDDINNYHNITEVELSSINWSFGMNCTTAIDNWVETSDTDLINPTPSPTPTTDNSGFYFDVVLGLICIGALALAPFLANWTGRDFFHKIFILVCLWLFFGFLFIQWIYIMIGA